MRLWHYYMVHALPDKQLVSQWRELCSIAQRISTIGYPNHILVNKIMYYSADELINYAFKVTREMEERGFAVKTATYDTFFNRIDQNRDKFKTKYGKGDGCYDWWHDERYYIQCYCNLQEKADCGAISSEEWNKIKVNALAYGIKIGE